MFWLRRNNLVGTERPLIATRLSHLGTCWGAVGVVGALPAEMATVLLAAARIAVRPAKGQLKQALQRGDSRAGGPADLDGGEEASTVPGAMLGVSRGA
jgi:hypothetical protein